MKLLIVALALLLGACNNISATCKPDAPLDVHIDPGCTTSCSTDMAIITDDPNTLVKFAHRCEARQALCINALKRAQLAGKIK